MPDNPRKELNEHLQQQIDAFEALPAIEQRSRLLILPEYASERDEYLQPDKIAVQFRYFWDHWVPTLGPLPSLLYMKLKQFTYYNSRTGEQREALLKFPKQADLAVSLGLKNRKTIGEALTTLEKHGLIRREKRYRYDGGLGKKVRTSDRFWVQLTDILTPKHQVEILVRNTTGKDSQPANISQDRPMSEKRTEVPEIPVDNPPPMSEKRTASLLSEKRPASLVLRDTNNVVQRWQKPFKDQRPGTTRVSPNPQREEWAFYIEDKLATIDPASTPYQNHRYYLLLADRLPREIIDQALTVVRDYRDDGKIRKSAPQAFHGTIVKMAEQAGIELPTKKPSNPGS